jgi:hypothetical protein
MDWADEIAGRCISDGMGDADTMRLVAEALRVEREACAKFVDDQYLLYLPVDETGDRTDQAIADVLYKLAASIRERQFSKQ